MKLGYDDIDNCVSPQVRMRGHELVNQRLIRAYEVKHFGWQEFFVDDNGGCKVRIKFLNNCLRGYSCTCNSGVNGICVHVYAVVSQQREMNQSVADVEMEIAPHLSVNLEDKYPDFEAFWCEEQEDASVYSEVQGFMMEHKRFIFERMSKRPVSKLMNRLKLLLNITSIERLRYAIEIMIFGDRAETLKFLSHFNIKYEDENEDTFETILLNHGLSSDGLKDLSKISEAKLAAIVEQAHELSYKCTPQMLERVNEAMCDLTHAQLSKFMLTKGIDSLQSADLLLRLLGVQEGEGYYFKQLFELVNSCREEMSVDKESLVIALEALFEEIEKALSTKNYELVFGYAKELMKRNGRLIYLLDMNDAALLSDALIWILKQMSEAPVDELLRGRMLDFFYEELYMMRYMKNEYSMLLPIYAANVATKKELLLVKRFIEYMMEMVDEEFPLYFTYQLIMTHIINKECGEQVARRCIQLDEKKLVLLNLLFKNPIEAIRIANYVFKEG